VSTHLRYAASLSGAAVLIGGVLTSAVASSANPLHAFVRSAAPRTTIKGDLYVNRVLHVLNNASFYGHTYAHDAAQVWKGLTVRTGGVNVMANGITVASGGLTVTAGGVKADSLVLSGPMQAQNGSFGGNLSVTGNLQTGAISGSTATLTGKLTSVGVDAGTGSITTTGALSAGSLSAATISTTGALTALNVTASGTLTAQNLNFSSGGSVNFANATVSGLTLGTNVNISGATASLLNVGQPSGTTSPLNLSENSKTVALGVDASGNLSVPALAVNGPLSATGALNVGGTATFLGNASVTGNATINGALSVTGNNGITANLISGPVPSGQQNPGPIGISGSAITLSGPTTSVGGVTLGSGSNLNLSTVSGGSASHIVANQDSDVAGSVSVTVTSGSGTSGQVAFHTAYGAAPIVILTPASDPTLGSGTTPAWYVTPTVAGFTVHVAFPTSTPSGSITFDYVVIGS